MLLGRRRKAKGFFTPHLSIQAGHIEPAFLCQGIAYPIVHLGFVPKEMVFHVLTGREFIEVLVYPSLSQ